MPDLWAKELEADLNWREAELASMAIVLLDAPKGSVKQRALLRAAWALLYAHYEGFSKFAWDLYLETLESKGLLRRDVCETLARFSMFEKFRQIKGSMTPNEIWEYCWSGFENELSQPLKFGVRLETKSNLWPDLFVQNSNTIGLVCGHMLSNEVKFKSLVGRRNKIAHGEQIEVKDFEEYRSYEECVLLCLHELALSIVDSLATNDYLKAP